MTFPTHPYWLSVPTIFMGYLTGSNKKIDRSISYSFLGTSTFLWTLRSISIELNHSTPRPRIFASCIGGALINGSIFCMGRLIGIAAHTKS